MQFVLYFIILSVESFEKLEISSIFQSHLVNFRRLKTQLHKVIFNKVTENFPKFPDEQKLESGKRKLMFFKKNWNNQKLTKILRFFSGLLQLPV